MGTARRIQTFFREVSSENRVEESDRDLLKRFLENRDEAAFTEIVRRHSSMVLGVANRVLRSHEKAEDVCQASFMLLARKAAGIAWQNSIANWLYGVAYNLSLNTRNSERRRNSRETAAPQKTAPDTLADVSVRELQAVLDEEIARLPGKYRSSVVLCCLEGYSRDEAAAALAVCVAAVKERLEEGRMRLRNRLARRGFQLSVALAGFSLSGFANAAKPSAKFMQCIAQTAFQASSGGRFAEVVRPQVAHLFHQGARTMFFKKLKLGIAFALTASLLSVAATGLSPFVLAGDEKPQASKPSKNEDQKEKPVPASFDLAKVDRKIGKEPVYQSKAPRYGLLAFGPDAKDRVWLVVDGDKLYVDRNSNGDLTERDEMIPVTKKREFAGGNEGYTFDVGEVTVGGRSHKGLAVYVEPLTALNPQVQQRPEVKAALAKNPKVQVVTMAVDVDVPGMKGGGLGGRMSYMVGMDMNGVLLFGDSPAEAPIIHLGGPLELTFFDPPTLRAGRSSELVLVVGTSGEGPGSFAMLAYNNTIPKDARAVVEAAYRNKGDGSSFQEKYVLNERCCTVNLYDTVRIPENADSTTGTFRLSLEGWKEGHVASTRHDVSIQPEIKSITEPEAANLFSYLSNPKTLSERNATVATVKFSGDRKRLFSSAYPTGVIQVWDLPERRELRRIESPPGPRGTMAYALFTPDEKSVYVPVEVRKLVESEKDGKKISRMEHSGSIRVWDLDTGEEKDPLKLPEGHSANWARLSPDGRYLACVELLDFEAGQDRKSITAVWDLQTRERKQIAEGYCVTLFSPDSKVVAVQFKDTQAKTSAVRLLETGTYKEMAKLECPHQDRFFSLESFSQDGSVLALSLGGKKGAPREVWFRSGRTLDDRGRFSAEGDPTRYGWGSGQFSNNGTRYIVTNANKRVAIWDVAGRKVIRTIEIGAEVWNIDVSPDGNWLATAWIPNEFGGFRTIDPRDLPQPRVALYDLAGSSPPRTMIAPHGYVGGLAFSPDGKTLAFGTSGGVRFFDLTR